MKLQIITLLAGESIDVTTGLYGEASSAYIDRIVPDGFGAQLSARTRGNVDGEKRDRSTTGVFVAGDNSKVLDAPSMVQGPFDKVYNGSASIPVRVYIMSVNPSFK